MEHDPATLVGLAILTALLWGMYLRG